MNLNEPGLFSTVAKKAWNDTRMSSRNWLVPDG